MKQGQEVVVGVVVDQDPASAWETFTAPDAITDWNFASEDWCCPRAENDLRVGGAFSYRMEACDGSMGFDFAGRYVEVVPHERIRYALGDDRDVVVEFIAAEGGGTRVIERFVAENEVAVEQQRAGWQAILDRYKQVADHRKREAR